MRWYLGTARRGGKMMGKDKKKDLIKQARQINRKQKVDGMV